MKVFIISDSHGNIVNLKHVMGFAEKINVGAVIHAGDWDDVKSVETVLEYKLPLYSVLGNADVDPNVEKILRFRCKEFDPDFLKIEIDGKKIGIIHKVKKDDIRFTGLDIVFSGHYHFKEEKMVNTTKFVRPGGIINGINFAVYETTSGEVEFVEDDKS